MSEVLAVLVKGAGRARMSYGGGGGGIEYIRTAQTWCLGKVIRLGTIALWL